MLDTLATPALVIDAAIVQRNIDRIAGYAASHGLALRPHTKTHKSVYVARLQLNAGAIGLTVAKAGEAEVMATAADDLLVAYPAVDPIRAQRLAQLALRKTVRVGIDSAFGAASLGSAANQAASTIGILVDVDLGMHRTGVQSPDEAINLARLVDGTPGLRFDGLMCYPGHISGSAEKQVPGLKQAAALLAETIDRLRSSGLPPQIISSGSTPTARHSHHMPGVTEIRPGTYVYNDMNIVRGGYCTIDNCAARVICTVVSTAVPGQVVLDAGSKTLTSDLCGPAPESGHGYIVEYPLAVITKLTEEHAQVDVRQCSRPPRIGERVSVIPNHICPCVNLHDSVWWYETDGTLRPLTIDARGKLV